MMIKQIFLISLFILASINFTAQTWEVTNLNSKDRWGDPIDIKQIKQRVEGFYKTDKGILEEATFDKKIIVEIERVVPSEDDFRISVYDLNGEDYRVFGTTIKVEVKPNKSGGITPTGKYQIIEPAFLFRYKIGDKESYFVISNPRIMKTAETRGNKTIHVNYSELNAILLSTSSPIKCIISDEEKDLISFRLYPANYKQLVR